MESTLTEKPGDLFAQAERELQQSEVLSKYGGPFFTFFFWCFSQIFAMHLFLFINNYGQASALEVALCFPDFLGSKLLNGCLVVWPSNLCLQGIQQFQDSKSTFIIGDYKIFPKISSIIVT